MKMNLKIITPPVGEPLSLADARAFARIGSGHEDTLLTGLIASARARIEAITGLTLIRRTYQLTLKDWPLGVLDKGVLRLPRPPAAGLVAVMLTDGGPEAEDVTASFVLETGLLPGLKPAPGTGWVWPRSIHQNILVEWEAGYSAPEDIPDDLIHALRLVVTHDFEHRDASDYRAQDRLHARLLEVLAPWREVRL